VSIGFLLNNFSLTFLLCVMHYEAVGYSLWRYICRIRKWWTKSQGWKMQDLENDGPGARCLPWSHQICFMPNLCYGVLFVIKKVLSGWHKRACIVKRAAEGGKLAYQRFQLTTNFYTFLSHLQNATVKYGWSRVDPTWCWDSETMSSVPRWRRAARRNGVNAKWSPFCGGFYHVWIPE